MNSGRLDRFDRYLPRVPWSNPWQPDGSYDADHELLAILLDVAAGSSPRTGIVAGAADVWAAEELRRAGFHEDDVWPRRTAPRVLPRDVRAVIDRGLTTNMRAVVQARLAASGGGLPAEAHVMGRAYPKQGDVVIASWQAGVEVLVSTKTMLSSYQKNLRNRFEEAYGDAKNLRGRHPLAALGFLFVVGPDIPATSRAFAIDMLRKLTSEPDVYSTACLVIIGEEAAHQPADLGPDHFFATLIGQALDHMPLDVYPTVRQRRRDAGGGDGSPLS